MYWRDHPVKAQSMSITRVLLAQDYWWLAGAQLAMPMLVCIYRTQNWTRALFWLTVQTWRGITNYPRPAEKDWVLCCMCRTARMKISLLPGGIQ